MKGIFGLLMAMWLALGAEAAYRVADNNPGVSTGGLVYASAQDAITASAAGDTVYIVPSYTSYGNITINKRLVVLGAGILPNAAVQTGSRWCSK
ncbi:MAG: hypothetical protein HC842_03225 [Cytophagales bacterium]|nr:hypothetical protein [Cytophagales bacterium]